MFEDLTKEAVQERILNRLPEDEDITPHSPLYIITAETAYGWELFYTDQNTAVEQCFFDTANREYLERHAKVYHIFPYDASHSQVEGEFNIEVEIGSRFSKEAVNFTVAEFLRKEGDFFYYNLICEQSGEIGNVAPGKILPINFIDNLTHAYITQILIPGEEVEDTETFRQRFLDTFVSKAFCGNLSDYFKELNAFEGVGKFKVLRCMNYKGEVEPEWVTVVFTDSMYNKPSRELVSRVQDYFQELDENGLPSTVTSGTGLSPIGQLCWVEGVQEETIDFGLNLTFESDYSWNNLQETIRLKIEERLKQYVVEDWGDVTITKQAYNPSQHFITIRRAEIESLLMDIEGIQDSTAIKINGEFKNYELAWNAIPRLGEVFLHNETEGLIPGNCPFNCPDCKCNHNQEVCERC